MTPRSSIGTLVDLPPSTGSLSPTPTPTPVPVTPSRSRQLSEIVEEGERKSENSRNSAQPVTRNETKRGSDGKLYGGDTERERGGRWERGGRPEGGKGRGGHRRRQSAADVDTAAMKKVRSRENLLQAEQQGSHSRHESPRRETSRSPSLTPLHGDTRKDSPRTERRKIINKLKKIARETSPMSSDGEMGEKSQPTDALSAVATAAGQKEREADLESSLDYQTGVSAAVVAAVRSGSTGEEPTSVNIDSPLGAILTAMESET